MPTFALAAVLALAADSQALPRAELDDAIKAANAAAVDTLTAELATARKAVQVALKLPAKDRREAAAVARAKVAELEKEIAAARKVGAVPEFPIEAMEVGKVGYLRLFYSDPGRSFVYDGPRKRDGSFALPIEMFIENIIDETTVRGWFQNTKIVVKTDTAPLEGKKTLKFDAPIKVIGAVDENGAPVYEVRFFAK